MTGLEAMLINLPPVPVTLAGMTTGAVAVISLITLNIFAVALLFAIIRLMMGPRLADRVIALDLIGALSVGIIAAYAVLTNEPMLLRTGIVVALVAFVGTVAFAMFLEKRGGE